MNAIAELEHRLRQVGIYLINIQHSSSRHAVDLILSDGLGNNLPMSLSHDEMASHIHNTFYLDHVVSEAQHRFLSHVSQVQHYSIPSQKTKCSSCGKDEHDQKLDWRGRCSNTLILLNQNRQKLHSHRLLDIKKLVKS